MTVPPGVKVGTLGRYKAQALGYPDASRPKEWQNTAHGDNRQGIIRIACAFLDCPGCNEVRVFDSVENVVINIEDSAI